MANPINPKKDLPLTSRSLGSAGPGSDGSGSESHESASYGSDGSGSAHNGSVRRSASASGSARSNPALTQLFKTAESVHRTSRILLGSIEMQIEAIKTADLVQLEELTDSYSTTLSRFRQLEDQLIEEMSRAADRARTGLANGINSIDQSDDPSNRSTKTFRGNGTGQVVRLRDLSTLYPASAKKLDNWRNLLDEGVRNLSLKQEQLTRLLEFAVDQNSQLLSTIYQLSNRDSSHYGPDGKASAAKPGSAVNHKV